MRIPARAVALVFFFLVVPALVLCQVPLITEAVTSASATCPIAPAPQIAFPGGSRVWFFFTYIGANVGDTFQAQWVQNPGSSGQTVFLTNTPVAAVANAISCYQFYLDLPNDSSSEGPLPWGVALLWNGISPFNNEPDSASLPVVDFLLTNGAKYNLEATTAATAATCPTPANPAPAALPTPKSSFLPTDSQVYFAFTYTGGNAGDNYVITWIKPDSTQYVTGNYTQAYTGGTSCYSSFMDIAGYAPASLPGNWTVQLSVNGFTLTSRTFSISPNAPLTVPVTVTTFPPGLPIVVDNSPYTTQDTSTASPTPLTFLWVPGASHTIGVTIGSLTNSLPGEFGGANYGGAFWTNSFFTFTGWSDGGPYDHSINVPSTATTYTASFDIFWALALAASPASDGYVTVSPGPPSANVIYGPPCSTCSPAQPPIAVRAGTTVQLTASTGSGFQFSEWTGDASGTANPVSLTVLDKNYSVTAVFVAQGSQTITFAPLPTVTLSAGTVTLSATASSGLPVSFASTTPTVCTVSGNTATIIAAGTCSITASQAGNTSYAPATPVTQSFAVEPASTSSVNVTSVGNAASFTHAFAPGMLMSVFGTGLSSGSPQTVVVTPLTLTSSSGTSVTINGIPAPLLYVSSTQINLQIPYQVPVGEATLTVNYGGRSGAISFTIRAAGPGIFVDSNSGNIVPTESAAPGANIGLFVTGAGLVTPPEVTGGVPAVGTTPIPNLPVTMTVGGVPATLVYVGIPSWSVGTLQINFIVPGTLAAGSHPVVVTIGGVSSKAALLTVKPL